MCTIYNSVGCLTELKALLKKHRIKGLDSLKDIIEISDSYFLLRTQIISQHEEQIEKEKKELESDLLQLDSFIAHRMTEKETELLARVKRLNQKLSDTTIVDSKNKIQQIVKLLIGYLYTTQIWYYNHYFNSIIRSSVRNYTTIRNRKNARFQYIISNFKEAVEQSGKLSLKELDHKKRVLDGSGSLIAGAIGEQRVVEVLEKLSDEHYLINDFSVSLSKPIYKRQSKDYIKSIQIDHILIAPSGVFLIETKNWSAKSLTNYNLWSPVQQIHRTSFVLYKLLNNKIANHRFNLDKHPWGSRKILIRELIVMIGSKPNEEFDHVKILTLSQLLGYIRYFKPVFSQSETKRITEFLLGMNKRRAI